MQEGRSCVDPKGWLHQNLLHWQIDPSNGRRVWRTAPHSQHAHPLGCFPKAGGDDEELLPNPALTPGDLSASWAYYEQYREEGDRTIAAIDENGDD
jgi:hypothetical protein